jgi:hypothetical protein
VNYGRDRLQGKEQALNGLMGRILNGSVGEPEFRLTDPSGRPVVGAEIQVFHNWKVKIVALQSNPPIEAPRTAALTPPGERFVYDIRGARPMGKQTRLSVQLDPYEPTILSVSPAAMPALTVSGPRTFRPGLTGTFAWA